jgi:hypothetical protein
MVYVNHESSKQDIDLFPDWRYALFTTEPNLSLGYKVIQTPTINTSE